MQTASAANEFVFDFAGRRISTWNAATNSGIMPEHVHLRLSESHHDILAHAIQSLNQGVWHRLIGAAEHFWQKRYYDFNLRRMARI